ncbi:hypothetical protein PAPHI01_0258 [Pancytospora philotis]|nr:hypothetical protein PAPHI01_0258 [Pancytospora philotis]
MFATVFSYAALLSAAVAPANDVSATGISYDKQLPINRWFSPNTPFLPREVKCLKDLFVDFINTQLVGNYDESLIAAIRECDWSDMNDARKRVDGLLFQYDGLADSFIATCRRAPTFMLAVFKFYSRTQNVLGNASGERFRAFKSEVDEFLEDIKRMDYTKYTSEEPSHYFARKTILTVTIAWGKVKSYSATKLDTIWNKLVSLDTDKQAQYVLIEHLAVIAHFLDLDEWLYSNEVLPKLFQLAVDLGKLSEVTFFKDTRYAKEFVEEREFCVQLVKALAGIHTFNGVQLTDAHCDNRARSEYYAVLCDFCYKYRKQLASEAGEVAGALHHHFNPGYVHCTILTSVMSAAASTYKEMPLRLVYVLYYFISRPLQSIDKDLLVRFSERLEHEILIAVLCYAGKEEAKNDRRIHVLTKFVEGISPSIKKELLDKIQGSFPHTTAEISGAFTPQVMRNILAVLKNVLEGLPQQ